MSNELTPDAEESTTTETTANEQSTTPQVSEDAAQATENSPGQDGPELQTAVEAAPDDEPADIGAALTADAGPEPGEITESAPEPVENTDSGTDPVENMDAGQDTTENTVAAPSSQAGTPEPAAAPEPPAAAAAPSTEPPSDPVAPRTSVRTVAKPANWSPTPAPAPPAPPAPKPRRAAKGSKAAPGRSPSPEAAPESTDIDFGAILEQFEQEQTIFHPGQLVSGTVVGTTDRGVLVDFGYKSEGFVPLEELTGPDGQLTVATGDEIDVVIRNIHSGDNAPQLSRTDALGRKVWDEIESAYQSGTPITGKVVDKTKGGLKVEINGVEAFLPGSQIDSRPIRQLDTYMGEDIEARVIKFSRRRNNIVLSRKVITDEIVNAQKAETMSHIEVGYIVEGTIKNLTEYGAFVDIGGIDGLLHVTDMSWGRIHHPSDQFRSGQHIQVKILKLDREKEKISLGYKQLLPDPWSTVVEVYPADTKVMGTVSSVTDYGVFVELEPGVEGLVHVSEISWSHRAQSPKRIFHKGQQVEVQVLGVDTVEKRISLGMKQFQENPWDSVSERYPVGTRVRGRVRNITDFGAFIELEEGIDGLVHVSDITWGKKIKHPKDVLKKDQDVEAIVTSVDRRGQRLSLSMKDLTPSAWEGFVATHRPGDVVRGKVSRFTNFGIFVELGDGLEGLCHISELSDERVTRAEDIATPGQEMDFKILRIEPQEQKIGLSHRAVGKDEGPAASPSQESRIYSTEAKGGMASLGELANLKFGSPAPEPAPAESAKDRKKARRESAAAANQQQAQASEAVDDAAETAAETLETASGNSDDAAASKPETAQDNVVAGESESNIDAAASPAASEESQQGEQSSEAAGDDSEPAGQEGAAHAEAPPEASAPQAKEDDRPVEALQTAEQPVNSDESTDAAAAAAAVPEEAEDPAVTAVSSTEESGEADATAHDEPEAAESPTETSETGAASEASENANSPGETSQTDAEPVETSGASSGTVETTGKEKESGAAEESETDDTASHHSETADEHSKTADDDAQPGAEAASSADGSGK